MDKVMLYNFSKTEHLFYDNMIKKLAPNAEFENKSVFEDYKKNNYDSAIINCTTKSWNALEVISEFIKRKKKIVAFSSQIPNAYFLCLLKHYVEKKKSIFPLICPENSSDISYCAEAFAKNGACYSPSFNVYDSKSDQIEKYFCISKLSDLDKIVVYGIISGESAKVIASITGKTKHYIECRVKRVKERCACLQSESTFNSVLSFLNT